MPIKSNHPAQGWYQIKSSMPCILTKAHRSFSIFQPMHAWFPSPILQVATPSTVAILRPKTKANDPSFSHGSQDHGSSNCVRLDIGAPLVFHWWVQFSCSFLIYWLIDRSITLHAGGEASDSECSAVSRSRTFEGDCESKRPCADACRREGYLDGYCFTDVAGPDHRVCMCTKQCMPARQPQLSS